ncbi:MAG: 3'-5' exonuclease [Victivallales bacterium]|nr:3'-5' exonuclease [Victivallales bacterium]
MIRVAECDLVALDFETTGTAEGGFLNTPWQIGLVVIANGRVTLERSFQSLLHVPEDQPFNPYAPGRWAQLRHELAQAPAITELWPQLQPMLIGHPLVAHHAPTERTLLRQLFPLQEFGPWIDTLAIARMAFPKLSDYKLENLVPALGLAPLLEQRCPGLASHDAFYDAVACATLLETVLAAPGWNHARIEELAALR